MQAGFRVLGAVEIDPLAADTYKRNHRRVKLWQSDIRNLPVARVMRELNLRPGQLDLLAGCPPCQGFSTLTTRNGRRTVKDKRNDLIFDFLRFVRRMRPKAVMLENVPGLSKDLRGRRFTCELEALGYHVNQAVLDAADYGVPQRRRRFIVLAGRYIDIPFGRPARRRYTVREAFAKLGPCANSDPLHSIPEKRSSKVRELIRRIPPDGGGRLALRESDQLNCHRNIDGFYDIYGRMAWDSVSPTITGGCCNPSKGRFLHPTKNRNVTLREAALLQSFPRRYVFSLDRGKFAVAQMIGNALPPEFIRRHAISVKQHLHRVSNVPRPRTT
jgi:DNA (cytosine-5)-methyltransferase 1